MSDPGEEARELLVRHGLPAGLLPRTVAAARIEGDAFEVRLTGPVERLVDDVPVWYAEVVAGRLGPGRIDGLRGVKAKKFVWVPVTAISTAGEDLVFAVGPLSDRVPRRFFG